MTLIFKPIDDKLETPVEKVNALIDQDIQNIAWQNMEISIWISIDQNIQHSILYETYIRLVNQKVLSI